MAGQRKDWKIETIPSTRLTGSEREEIFQLCEQAYQTDLRPYLRRLKNPSHLIVRPKSKIVGHACCIERWLQVENRTPLRTSYVEAVATHPEYQRQGLGTALLKQALAWAENFEFEIGGLSPACVGFYQRRGWELWQGPLFYRKNGERFACSKDEVAMVHRLARTPDLQTHQPLSIEWRPGEEVW